jgi:hypothetical protein
MPMRGGRNRAESGSNAERANNQRVCVLPRILGIASTAVLLKRRNAWDAENSMQQQLSQLQDGMA